MLGSSKLYPTWYIVLHHCINDKVYYKLPHRKKGSCCPVDSHPLKSESDLFRDLHTDREISQIHVNCPYRQFGCKVELSPVDMNTHMDRCTYKTTLSESQGMCFTCVERCIYSKICSLLFFRYHNLYN